MALYPTDTYQNLEERFKSLAGLQALETTDAAFLRQSINRRIRTAYERYAWPEFTVVGETVNVPTAAGNIIRISGISNGVPSSKLANNANVVFRIHKERPTRTKYPSEYTFVSLLDSSGYPAVKIIKTGSALNTDVYVTYRKELNDIISDGGTYSSKFFGDESGDNPNIPYTFFEYAAFGAYADFLRGDGQTQKAQIEDQNAELILRSEIDKVQNQSRQFRHDVLQYRPSTQFRRHNVQAGGSPLNPSQQMFGNNVQ